MSIMYCEVCDNYIDLDWDVEHEVECLEEYRSNYTEQENTTNISELPPVIQTSEFSMTANQARDFANDAGIYSN